MSDVSRRTEHSHDRIPGLLVSSSVVLEAILLVLERDCDSAGCRQVISAVVHFSIRVVAKRDAPESRDLCPSWCGRFCDLARPHDVEVRHYRDLRHYCFLAVTLLLGRTSRTSVHVSQQLGSYCPLLLLRRVTVIACLQPHLHEGAHVG